MTSYNTNDLICSMFFLGVGKTRPPGITTQAILDNLADTDLATCRYWRRALSLKPQTQNKRVAPQICE